MTVEMLTAIFCAAVCALSTCVIVAHGPRRPREPQRNELMLPLPGPNLELYTRVKDLLDSAAHERDEARAESARLRTELAAMVGQHGRIEARLRSANDLLRAWTHPKMSIDLISPVLHEQA